MRFLRFASISLILAGAAGCPSCAPETVGEGVARLTVRNVGGMVILLGNDTRCGFASDAVRAGAVVEGEAGSQGTVTTKVEGCTLDLGSGATILDDCNGTVWRGSGRVTVDATETVTGLVTGDAANPVVPASPDAATITISKATFDNFRVTWSTSSDQLTMVKGSLSAVAKPRLAVSASTGVCAVPTLTTAFSHIQYAPSTVHVKTATHDFDTDVASSDIAAQTGKGAASENAISGQMTVFGQNVDVRGDGALDPDYDAGTFTSSYACNADVAQPVSFACTDPTRAVADASARLGVKMLGTVTSLVDADTTCGFSSPATLAGASIEGTAGGLGTVTFKVDGCTLHYTHADVLTDCTGASTVVDGSVTVTGTKIITGFLTGDPADPIVPATDLPAAFDLSLSPDHFSVSSTNDANGIVANSGTLTGVVHPRAFLGAATGVCSVASPDATFQSVTWTNADLTLSSAQGPFPVVVDTANIDATNGVAAGRENELSGSVALGGTSYPVPADASGLDPNYSRDAFDAAWQCNPDLARPISTNESTCESAVSQQIAGGVASLTMRTFATVASLVDQDPTCGFASADVAGSASTTGATGDGDGTMTLTLPSGGCTLSFPADTVIARDCNGNTTSVSGTVVVKGTKSVTGFLTGDPAQPIVPTSDAPAQLTLSMAFDGFVVTTGGSSQSLVANGGSLSGSVRPRTALDPSTGVCSVVTPNATFADIAWQDGKLTLRDGDKAFDVAVSSSDLTAQAGSDDATTNSVTGDIVVADQRVRVTGMLDPAFDQASFDSSYLCDTGLGVPILVDNAQCSFRDVLGNAAARLLVETAAVTTSVLHSDTSCGFADATPTTAPVQTGQPGALGNVTFSADADCTSAFPASTVVATDCAGGTTAVTGMFTASSATESVNGFLTGNPASPVLPVTRDAATFTLQDVSFDGFHVVAPGGADVTVNGTLGVVVRPIAGRSASASAAAAAATAGAVNDVYTVETPVGSFSQLTMPTGSLVITRDGKTFRVDVSDVALDAFAGSFGGVTNTVSGSLTVDGKDVVIPAGSPLVTPYDQAAFDASYTCNPDLAGDVVPH